MGSRNTNGTKIGQPDWRIRHLGAEIQLTSQTGADSTIANTDTSVEREKFTSDSTSSGNLSWEYTRKLSGIHTSISTLEARSSSDKPETVTERKVFFVDSDRGLSSGFADWMVFSDAGEAVGAADGTTDTDVTPTGTFDERPHYDG